jgi:aryl-alcohol dehydrogenase-like predicted oxidoreductase
MDRRSVGSLELPVVGVGCNNFGTRLDQVGTTAVVDAAIEAGCGFFDTADIYGATLSEQYLGIALGERRGEVLIATKFGGSIDGEPGGASPAYVRRACEASLARLGTDHIDLYQLHMPDPEVPLAETMGALDELVEAGLVREIGCSNFTAAMLVEANAVSPGAQFASVQNQYSLLWREPEESLLAELDRQGAGLLPYYPLANGLLTGKYRKGAALPEGARLAILPESRTAHWLSEAILDDVEAIRAIAEAAGLPMLDLAFSWLLARPQVSSVIAGASSPEQVAANAASVVELDPQVLSALDVATAGRLEADS